MSTSHQHSLLTGCRLPYLQHTAMQLSASVSVSACVLQIELNWLLDDTVDAAQASAGGQWMPCTWRQLQSNMDLHHPEDTSNASSQSIALRADISTLTQLWKQRTQDRCAFCSFSDRHWQKSRHVETWQILISAGVWMQMTSAHAM